MNKKQTQINLYAHCEAAVRGKAEAISELVDCFVAPAGLLAMGIKVKKCWFFVHYENNNTISNNRVCVLWLDHGVFDNLL